MAVMTEQETITSAAFFAARMIKLAHGYEGVLFFASISEIAETLIDLNEGNMAAAEAALLAMDEAGRMEALGLDLDDPQSYAVAQAARLFA